jgi:hypothetical protein
MKRFIFLGLLFICLMQLSGQTWQPVGNRIKTKWAEQIDPANPLPEYPRPQMKRD